MKNADLSAEVRRKSTWRESKRTIGNELLNVHSRCNFVSMVGPTLHVAVQQPYSFAKNPQ